MEQSTGPAIQTDTVERHQLRIIKSLLNHEEHGTTDLHPDGPRFVPATEYRDENLHRSEIELFRSVPSVVAVSAEIPTPKSYQAKTIAGVPVLVVRGDDGVARTFLNACAHRGAQLCEGSGEIRGSRIVCPYHAWSYHFDGRLANVMKSEHVGDLAGSTYKLISLPCEERHGLVFSMLDPSAELNLDHFLGDFDGVLKRLGLSGKARLVRRKYLNNEMNWKIAYSTYCESYHFTRLHAKSFGPSILPDTACYEQYGPHLSFYAANRTLSALRGLSEDAVLARIAAGERVFGAVHLLFPNTVITGFGPHQASHVVTVLPGANAGLQSTDFRFIARETTDEQFLAMLELQAEVTFNAGEYEDYDAMIKADKAITAGMLSGVTFGANEPALTEVHRNWARALGRKGPDVSIAERPAHRLRNPVSA